MKRACTLSVITVERAALALSEHCFESELTLLLVGDNSAKCNDGYDAGRPFGMAEEWLVGGTVGPEPSGAVSTAFAGEVKGRTIAIETRP